MAKLTTSDSSHRELEGIIDSVSESYGQSREIDSLESAALPNRRKVIEAVECLERATYMGFYSTRELSQVNLRQHIGDHIYDAFEILVEQISRAVVYQRLRGGAPTAEDVAWSERATLCSLSRLPEVRSVLATDVDAAYAGDPAAGSIEEIIFSYPAIKAISIYRLAHEFYECRVPLIPRIMTEYAHSQTGIDINPGAKVGRGFFIDHGTGVVVGETSVIGDNVKLYQGVTLGALSVSTRSYDADGRPIKRHPTLEDDVTIYSGATILGGHTVIGKGSTVGGNVWLTESVAAGSRVTYRPSTCEQASSVKVV